MRSGRCLMRAAALAAALSSIALSAEALEPCEPVVGRLASFEGEVEVQRAGETRWQPGTLDGWLCQGDAVRVGERSRAALALINDAIMRLDQNTTMQLTDITIEPEERSLFQLIAGAIQSFSRSPRLLAVNTPYLNATIEGTEFALAADEDQSSITVLEGVVRAANELGEVRVASGEAAVAEAGQAPRGVIVVRPRDAVQWALYYPPVLALRPMPPDLPPALARALELAERGETRAALASLDQVPEAQRDARWQLYRASLLLSVGRVDEAEAAIDQALARDPDAGSALALRSIIQIARNEQEALATARRAVELSPDLSAPRIALSYALQANFELEAAREVLLETVEQHPEDALAWARLAELWLSTGYRDRAREAAERAVALAPDLARTQVVLGFANLTEFRTGAAKDAFGRAIEREPANPLAHFGLGLAQIRESDLEQGRENIEVAVALDANSSILRSYLGKAYFEEVRTGLANDQYAIAKELDPFDPTPHLYEAIKLQTENRPVEALGALQTSIELNDNRAVYRSRLQLEEDRAARGTSLARVYDDLGFQQLGLRESTKSLAFDPTNAAAHRFLSDVYSGLRRREIARVSELLQAQMLQDVNINPVQPSLSETNLNIVTQGGPAEAGFNEFTPLFERQQAQLNVTGLAGNNDTYGGEGVASMLYDRYSVSAGYFHFQTDGWRPNHDIDHDIYNAFFQAAITPELNAQVEFRRRRSELGDLVLNFDPDDFFPDFEHTFDQDIARAGLRYSPTPNSDLLFSAGYSDFLQSVSDLFDTPDGPGASNIQTQEDGYQVEGQYLYRRDRFNILTGAAYGDFDRDIDALVTIGGTPVFEFDRAEEVTHPKVYGYLNLNFPDPVIWTVGVSYDHYEQAEIDVEEVNPKFGVQWFITDDLVLRGAAFQVVKPALSDNRTLEPTQVAGFNQLFDEANGTKSFRYGVGLDWQVTNDLAVGAEATWRDLDFATIDFSEEIAEFFDHDEQTHRAYVSWTPLPEVALSAEFIYDRFEAERSPITIDGEFPEKLETISIPVAVRYFHRSGLFAGFSATFVDQEVERSPGSFFAEGSDNFFVLDASVGYRFPNRRGIASLAVSNLLDESFNYQDDSFREFGDRPSIGPYIPERQILGRITLNF